MSMILGIDPGPVETAAVLLDPVAKRVVESWYIENEILYGVIGRYWTSCDTAIEMIASYGMAVGAEVFDTCCWIGRFEREIERLSGAYPARIKRIECKMALCHNSRAKDPNIRQALLDMYGPVGTKKNPGPLFGISGDKWAALAVATTFSLKQKGL
jgi:hypothetical protein